MSGTTADAYAKNVSRTARGWTAQLAQSLTAGAIVGIISILFSLSCATLIFSGKLAPWVAYGLAATFITGAVTGGIIAWRSSLPFSIGGPDGPTCAIIAALVARIPNQFGEGAEEHFLGAALIALMMTAVLTGLLFCALGYFRAGRAIRFVPFPVIGGFQGASSCLMLIGSVAILTGNPLSLYGSGELPSLGDLEKMGAGMAVAAFLMIGRRYSRSPIAAPLQAFSCIGIFYLVILLSGTPLAQVQAHGWTFEAPSGVAFEPPWEIDFSDFPWRRLSRLGADFFAVMFVAAVGVLMNLTAIELTTKREADLDRELRTLGGANLLCGVLGGYAGCIAGGRSILNHTLGATGRMAGLFVAGLSAAAVFINPDFLSYMPKAVLGGLLITTAWDQFMRWVVGTRRQLAWLEYLSLLAIVAIIVVWGFVPGVSIGVIFGCLTFALSAGRVNVVKFAFDASEYRSSLDRGVADLELLAQHGRELQGLALQSYLFFGSANSLFERVKAILEKTPECRFLLFDFRHVNGIDSSATHSFTQIKRTAEQQGAKLVLVNLTPALVNAFANMGFQTKDVLVVPELDRALEQCENAIIAAHAREGDQVLSLRDWLAEAMGDATIADKLAAECKRLEFAEGDIIARQGAPADAMHFIVEGRVGVIVTLDNGHTVRVRSLGRDTTIGEMGLITGRPRSATAQAEAPTVAYELSAATFRQLKAQHPELAQALLTYVIGVMAERLSFASRLIGVLQR